MIVNIKKRYAYGIMGLLVLAVGVFVVYALTPGIAPNPGHLITEVAPPAGCEDGQVLQFIDEDNGWGCVDLGSGPTGATGPPGPAGSEYCYTYYSTSLASCVCPSGETNKKNLGSWGICISGLSSYLNVFFRAPSLSCSDISWGGSVDKGLACVCCK